MNWKCTSFFCGTDFETREVGKDLIIEGYFAVFDSKYWLAEKVFETIDHGAFDLKKDTDVRALTNHNTTLVLGRTSNGTLVLNVDNIGLHGLIRINRNDRDAVNVYERVKRGDVNQCSFGFDIIEQKPEIREDGITVWHLQKVKLYEVSICTFPAYEKTAVQARTNELTVLNQRQKEIFSEKQNQQKLSFINKRQQKLSAAKQHKQQLSAEKQQELELWKSDAIARLRVKKKVW